MHACTRVFIFLIASLFHLVFAQSSEYLRFARFPVPAVAVAVAADAAVDAAAQRCTSLLTECVNFSARTGIVRVRSLCGRVRLSLAAHGRFFRIEFPVAVERRVTLSTPSSASDAVDALLASVSTPRADTGAVASKSAATAPVLDREIRYQRVTQLHATHAAPAEWRYPLALAEAVQGTFARGPWGMVV